MDKSRTYEAEYKKEAVKLVKEVGARKASESLKIPYGTLYDWIKKRTKGALKTGESRTPAEALSLEEEMMHPEIRGIKHVIIIDFCTHYTSPITYLICFLSL